MNKSLYEQTVDSIQAPRKTVEHMLDIVRENEKKEKIIPMKNRSSKIKHIKRTAIAACLTAVLALGAVFGLNALAPKESPFVLSVNAAEITDKGYTPIGTLADAGGDFDVQSNGEVALTEYFIFNIRVEGENVADVTYTAENGYFCACSGGPEMLVTIHQDDVISEEMDDKRYTCLKTTADSADDSLPEAARQAVRDWNDHANTKLELPLQQEDYDDSRFDINDCEKTIYTAMFDRLSVGVEITYTDGRKENKTLVFSCDSVTDGGIETISAKLV